MDEIQSKGMCSKPESLKGVNAIVFISASMPDGSLRDLFGEARGRQDVQFVLRGWDDLPGLGKRLQEMMGKETINIVVHPELFRGYKIEAVPVFLIQKKGSWYRVTGNVSLARAFELAGTLKDPGEHQGEVYNVAEPDMLKVIEERVASYDWETAAREAGERSYGHWIGYADLPPAEHPDERRVDPSLVASMDITLPDGRVVVRAGDRVNPLDYIGLEKPVVIFNPQRRCELEYARSFPKDAFFLATSVSIQFLESFPREVFVVVPEAVERFGLRATPSVVVQEGQALKVTTHPCVD